MSGNDKTRPEWTHRPYADADLTGVAALRESVRTEPEGTLRRSGSADYYRWKLSGNPVLPGALEVAVSPREEVVGTASLTPKRVLLDGEEHVVAEIGDTFTSVDYRRQGMFSTLVRAMVAAGDDRGIEFIYGTPNHASLPGYEAKLSFAQIPGADVVSFVRPVRARAVLRNRLPSGALGALGAGALGSLIELGYKVALRPPRVPSGVVVRRDPSPPEEAEDLFERVKGSYRWITVRDASYLEWRYGKNPDAYEFISAFRDDVLVGYLVAKRGLWHGLDALYLADFLAVDGKAFRCLLGEALRGAPWADFVTAWTSTAGPYAGCFRRAGFLRYGRVPVICHQVPLGQRVVAGAEKWHFTMADSDNI